ncbi:hypothetical protein EDC01DRAFT_709140 [Geopyxis carbonaria]|nr:hypothetical protein EDC01DRAFT_709140 [Geopyxis carbonaria]
MRLIDSHIHLYTEKHLPHLSWMTPDSPLHGPHSVQEYLDEAPSDDIEGFVFIETDRSYAALPKLEDSDSTWLSTLAQPLEEYTFALSLNEEAPPQRRRERHPQLLGVLPWAPLPLGPAGVSRWLSLLPPSPLLKGFRYLVQDKPNGTISTPDFIAALLDLRRRGLAFDLGVDLHARGVTHVAEAVSALEAVFAAPDQGARGAIVVNHLCKPDLTLPTAAVRESEVFKGWAQTFRRLAACEDVYVKLSGGFSELDWERVESEAEMVDALRPWVRETFEIVGASRVMWGSDWPVCGIGYAKFGGGKEGKKGASAVWRRICETLLGEMGLSEAELEGVWAGNARRAYRL